MYKLKKVRKLLKKAVDSNQKFALISVNNGKWQLKETSIRGNIKLTDFDNLEEAIKEAEYRHNSTVLIDNMEVKD